MFGSLILPTGVKAGTRTGGGGIHPRDQLSAAIPYHPTMSMSFPSRNNTKSPARTTRIRASSFTADTLPLSKPNTNTNTTLNLYQILRIKHTASSLEIKTAYRKLAKQFHPDASPQSSSSSDDDDGGGRDFMEIHNAYATLSDPTERARYDLSIQIQSSSSSHRRYYSSGSAFVDGNENRSYGMQTRRWETDQCW